MASMISVFAAVMMVMMIMMLMAAASIIVIRPSCCRAPHLDTPLSASLMQSSSLRHPSSALLPLCLLAPRVALDSLPGLPCPTAVTLSTPSYICTNTVKDEGWRLQSLCPWRRCKRDKPAIQKDLDIYLPTDKRLNRCSFKVMPLLRIFQRLHFSLRTESGFPNSFPSALITS